MKLGRLMTQSFVAVLLILIMVTVVSAGSGSNGGITLTYPDGPNCVAGQDTVSLSVSPAPAGGVRFDFFGAIDQSEQLTYVATVVDTSEPFEAIVPYDQQFPIFAVFAALLDEQGNPIQGQVISGKWSCTFTVPTATATYTSEPPTATPTNTPEPPTATPTNTPETPTKTPEPPTATPTATPVTPTPEAGQGCTPGYWKQMHHFDSWPTGYATGQAYNQVFGVNSSLGGGNLTLVEALGIGGGGEKALARHAVAALLNAAHSNISYAYTVEQVIAGVQNAYVTGNYESFKNILDSANNAGCPLN